MHPVVPKCYVADLGSVGSWLLEAAQTACKGVPSMVNDLVLALVFLGMIVAPALITMRPARDEKDPL
jgi:hypothetical protein